MATANIVKVWKDSANAYACAVVAEGGKLGNVEYLASTPLADDQGNAYSAAELKANLIAALSVVRNAQLGQSQVVIGGISGTVTV